MQNKVIKTININNSVQWLYVVEIFLTVEDAWMLITLILEMLDKVKRLLILMVIWRKKQVWTSNSWLKIKKQINGEAPHKQQVIVTNYKGPVIDLAIILWKRIFRSIQFLIRWNQKIWKLVEPYEQLSAERWCYKKLFKTVNSKYFNLKFWVPLN